MNCQNCNTPIKEGQKFCTHCGCKLKKPTNKFDVEKIISICKNENVITGAIIILTICIAVVVYNINNYDIPDIKNAGVGVILEQANDYVYVKNAIPNMPAYNNISAGDIIIKVNNKYVSDIKDVTSNLRGKANTKVKLTVLQDHEEKTYTLKRIKIDALILMKLKNYSQNILQ